MTDTNANKASATPTPTTPESVASGTTSAESNAATNSSNNAATNAANNKRIAKNTLLLYVRTILVMVVSLFTSRIILSSLGVEDYGIYNIVGGVVAMFSVISGSLSGAISRYITFELGKGNKERLKTIFATSINIQIAISLVVLLIGETVGLWFLNYQMNIPPERLYAANWVLQCSLLAFVVNLISVPYNATIIAHERMSAFAYVSILEVTLKLIIVYALYISPWDRLITYAILLLLVSLIIRSTYSIYCKRHFEETKYSFIYDKALVKEMAAFGGWSFFTNCAYIFNTQGVNILINLFFGVGMNATRGIAMQVETAIMKFVNDFSTAINPQITKNYAAGNKEAMFMLICRGSKFAYLLLLLISLPVMMETDFILNLWLKEVPEYTAIFLRLSIVGTMINMLGGTGITACLATGNIKRYVTWVTSVGILVFPLTWLVFQLGAPVYATYFVFIGVYVCVLFVRLYIMKGLLDFPTMMFVRNVLFRILATTAAVVVLPLIVNHWLEDSLLRFIISTATCILATAACSFFIGLSPQERAGVQEKITAIINKKRIQKERCH